MIMEVALDSDTNIIAPVQFQDDNMPNNNNNKQTVLDLTHPRKHMGEIHCKAYIFICAKERVCGICLKDTSMLPTVGFLCCGSKVCMGCALEVVNIMPFSGGRDVR